MYEAHFKLQQWDFMPNRCLKLFFFLLLLPAVAVYACEFTKMETAFKVFEWLGTFAAAGAAVQMHPSRVLPEFSSEPLITAADSPLGS